MNQHLNHYYSPLLIFALCLLGHIIIIIMVMQSNIHHDYTFKHLQLPLQEPIITMIKLKDHQQSDEVNFTINLKENSSFSTVLPTDQQVSTNPIDTKQIQQKNIHHQALAEDSQLLVNDEQSKTEITTTINNKYHNSSRPLQLAAFTQGFINYTKSSASEINLSSTESTYNNYLQKVAWFLQNSLNACNVVSPLTLKESVNMSVTLHWTIEENGTISNYYTTPPIANKALNDFLKQLFTRVGLFPKLPAHIKQRPLKLACTLAINGKQGQHSYDLTFRQ